MKDDILHNKDDILYNYVQAAAFIKISDSTLRLWVQELDSILNLPESRKGTKRFRKSDIEKLKQIKKLITEDEFSLSQIKDIYMSKTSKEMVQQNTFELDKFTDTLLNEFDSKISSFKNDMLEQNKHLIFKLLENQLQLNNNISEQITDNNQNIINSIHGIKEDIYDTQAQYETEINNSLNKHFSGMKSEIDEIKESQNEQTEFAKFVMDQLKKQENQNKSWVKKLSLKFRLINTIKHK